MCNGVELREIVQDSDETPDEAGHAAYSGVQLSVLSLGILSCNAFVALAWAIQNTFADGTQ